MLAERARPSACGAVVKANAYGLGASAVARRLAAEGCRHFFVAQAEEAIAVRDAAGPASIYVFSGPLPETVAQLRAARAIPIVNHPAQLDAWPADAGAFAVHVDTGMNRLGFALPELAHLASRAGSIALLLTHLACADEPTHPRNAEQLARFAEAAARFPGVPTSVGNSAAIFAGASACGDIARPGIAIYGGNPFASEPNPMRTVATLDAAVLQLRHIEAGESVGYGATYRSRSPRLIATVGAGYADGVPRLLSNIGEAAFGGARLPYAGRVSMDLLAVDATEVEGRMAVGDRVELIGSTILLDEVAALARTIGYEILTGLGARGERRYVAS